MLNKKLLYITTAGLMASAFPVNTDAQTFYQCMPCPVGTYAKSGKCEACPLGTYTTSTGTGSCLSCDSTEFSNADRTRCFKVNDKENWNTSPVASPSAGKCVNYTIPKSGLYAVYLRGGHGSAGAAACHPDLDGKEGGYVAYKFIANAGTSIELCAGGNGVYHGTGGGGGAGSWIKIGGAYIVAGGGGGGGNVGGVIGGATNDVKGQAGGGGAIGGGGSGDDYKCGGYSGDGGSVGPYEGGAGQSYEHDGKAGTGINADNAGKGGRSGGGYGRGGAATGVTLYTGSVRVNVGGAGYTAGSATHNSNMSITLGCSSNATGCAALYSWRFN